ncbi:MAG: DUF4388 domain-containing protein [Candidatus Melainabacteria bacterium]|nr:DUF4388 domain-containing protein [Candidatus Melainabacteria bacterium]
MLNQTSRTKTVNLDERPTEVHLHELMKAAINEKNTSFLTVWRRDKTTYTLATKRVEELGGTYEWRMYSGQGGLATELWFHLTDDMMLVLRMLREAIGEQLAQDVNADQMKTFNSLPSLTKLKKMQADSTDGESKTNKNARYRGAPSGEEIPVTATFDTVPIYVSERLTQTQEHLTGSLDLVHITNLLQSVSLGQMTGRLRIQRPLASVDVFFDDGRPVHAAGTHSTGDECLLQVMCWKDGHFHFEPKIETDERTVNLSLNTLMLQGIQLSDNTEFLKRAGVRMQSVLQRVHERITERDFEQLMLKGEPVDMEFLKNFYLRVHGGQTVQQIVSQLQLQRSQWVQVAANLIRCGAVKVEKEEKERKKITITPKAIDQTKLDFVSRLLLNEETGLMTYSALLFLVGQEFKRTKENPFSLILFDIEPIRTGKAARTKSTQFLLVLSQKIHEVFNGFLAHYESHELALLVPGADANDVVRHAEDIKVSLLTSAGAAGIEASNISIGIGIASYPQDGKDLPTLLAATEMARNEAKKRGCAVILTRHLT